LFSTQTDIPLSYFSVTRVQSLTALSDLVVSGHISRLEI